MREQLTALPYLVRMALWAVAIMLAVILIAFFAQRLISPPGRGAHASVSTRDWRRLGSGRALRARCGPPQPGNATSP